MLPKIAQDFFSSVAAKFLGHKSETVAKRLKGKYFRIETFSKADDIKYKKDIEDELQRSSMLHVLTSRGNFLFSSDTDDISDNVFVKFMNNVEHEIVILLPDIMNMCVRQRWINQREVEMVTSGNAKVGFLTDGIIETLKHIEDRVIIPGREKSRKILFFDSLHIGSIIILSNCAYFTPYFSDKFGNQGRIYKYPSSSEMFKWIMRVFNSTREFADDYKNPRFTCKCSHRQDSK